MGFLVSYGLEYEFMLDMSLIWRSFPDRSPGEIGGRV
jgi:hypothetical protein